MRSGTVWLLAGVAILLSGNRAAHAKEIYCVFRFDGSPKAVRALACVSDDPGYCHAISEAR